VVFAQKTAGITPVNHRYPGGTGYGRKVRTVADEPSFYDKVKAMAEEMGLTGEEKDNYINASMEKKGGHKKITSWIPDDGKGDGDGKKSGTSWF
jgi:hypothetical protein